MSIYGRNFVSILILVLKVNDIITHVNNVCVIDVPHSSAVEALKKAGNSVHLTVKRKRHTNGHGSDFIEVGDRVISGKDKDSHSFFQGGAY